MKTVEGVIGACALLVVSAVSTSAIEDLKVSVQGNDAVLSWPSVETETYIVQHRPTLNPGTPWQMLTSSLSAAIGTNRTFFIHTNSVEYPDCGESISSLSGGEEQYNSMSSWEPSMPLVMPADGSGSAVPLILFPNGFDLSSFFIFDPLTEEWMSGEGYVIASAEFDSMSGDSLDPENPGDPEEGGSVACPPTTGFYRVVRFGPHLFGLTNGMTLSGIVRIPVELGLSEFDDPLDFSLWPDDEIPQPRGVQIYSFTGTNDVPHLVWDTHRATNGTYTLAPK